MYGKDNNYGELECSARISEEISKTSDQGLFNESNWDYLKFLLYDSNPSCDQLPTFVTGYLETPYLDVGFPVAHGYNLQVDDLIPVKLSNASHVASSKDLLRPSTRILCRAGGFIIVALIHLLILM